MGQYNNGKTGTLIGTGAVAAGVTLLFLNSNARNKIKDSSIQIKDTVGKYATTIKEDPKGTKNTIIEKVKRTSEISQDAMNKIQQILDNQGKEIKKTTKDVVEQSKEVADQSKEVASTAKDAQDDLKDVGKEVKENAKDEMPSKTKSPKETNTNELEKPTH